MLYIPVFYLRGCCIVHHINSDNGLAMNIIYEAVPQVLTECCEREMTIIAPTMSVYGLATAGVLPT